MASKTTTDTKDEDEGARGFAHTLRQLDDGSLHDELSEKLRGLVSECGAYAERYERDGKGTLTLVLTLSASANGSVAVIGDVKVKPPVAKRSGSVFYRTKGDNLTLDNPRQQKLALREVQLPVREAKDITKESAPVRGV